MTCRNRRILTPIAAAVALLSGVALAHPGMAQAVTSMPDGSVACAAFQRHGYGSWTVLRPAAIYPDGVPLSLAPGQTFAPNQHLGGFEITAILDRNCGNP